MAPRGGRGGGGGGSGGRSGGSSSSSGELQFRISNLYGGDGMQNSVFTQSSIIGSMVIYIIYTICILFALLIIKNVKKPKLQNDKRIRLTWVCALQVAGLLFLVPLVLQAARWALLEGDGKVGKSFRVEEPITELFGGVTEIILLGIMSRLTALVLEGLVPKSGPDPALAKLRKWVDISITGVSGVVTAVISAQVTLGFAIAKKAFDAYQMPIGMRQGVWRLGDRDVATQLNSMAADASYFRGVLSSSDSPNEIWDSLTKRFTTPDGGDAAWINFREAQIALEITRNVLVLIMVLIFGYLAFKKRGIANNKDSKNLIARHSSTIVRGFLHIVFPSLLNTIVVRLVVSVHFNLHNFHTITSHSQWTTFRSLNPRFFSNNSDATSPAGLLLTHLNGFLPSYRTTFKGFPIYFAILKNFGWIVTVVMLAILTRRVAGDKKKEVVQEEMRKEARQCGMPYAQLAAMEEREPKKKGPRNWNWIWY